MCGSIIVIGMTRPLRLEFAGALYHVTARGDRRHAIYRDDTDRIAWLQVLGQVCERHHFVVHGFCQMTNHYHLLLETAEANLSQGMRQLNGLYSQHFNRRHRLVGHLFQGRYKAILVQKENYLLTLIRYIVLNPLRARMVSSLDAWHWSSHHYYIGDTAPPCWLERDWLLQQFGAKRNDAVAAYYRFVLAGIGAASPLSHIRHQVLLGNEAFVAKQQQSQRSGEFREAAMIQRRAVALPLAAYRSTYANRDEAMARAYLSAAYTMSQIAAAFGVSTRTVSRALCAFENSSN
ncbi:transposase [Janthinobacterium sp.]|uniref:transposase n=1 Tax=Janthinobacterium sp. TaxID=1871054 RepID=UPI0025868959|nr:transposase [Janthinobacterium sp.]